MATAARSEGLRIFISYRRKHASAAASELHNDLVDRFGIRRVFMDLSGIEPGEDFVDELDNEIRHADVFLAIVDPLWAVADETGRSRLHDDNDYVRMEVEDALLRNITVIPVLVDGARLPSHEELPSSIALFARRQWFELSEERWHADVARLMARLERIEAAKRSAAQGTAALGSVLVGADTTSFVGRDQELAWLHAMLEDSRVVTIVGPGGVGKTRLASKAIQAADLRRRGRVGTANLATLPDESLLLRTVADALGMLTSRGQQVTLDWLIEQFADARFLLVLDNCEHVIVAVAELVGDLVGRCPGAQVLATSRRSLGVKAEKLLPLEPFAAPATSSAMAVEELLTYSAVQLFVDRARDASPSFALDERDGPSVAQIVELLDGLPLAIELAAARVAELSIDNLVSALVDRFDPAVIGRRGDDPRHQTLWSMVDWSYELLGTGDRLVFERLSVFAGDFSMTAAESVCSAASSARAVRSSLLRLLAHSLVQRTTGGHGEGRLRLLYTIREYAQSRLAGRPGDPTMAELQAWGVGVAGAHGRAVDVGDELAGLAVLDAERPNLLGALRAGLVEENGATVGAIAAALAPYWDLRGNLEEGATWVDKALALLRPDDDDARGPCLLAAARLTPDFARRKQLAAQALVAADRMNDREYDRKNDVLASAALSLLGHTAVETNDVDAARLYLEAALERGQAGQDEPSIALASERLSFMPGWEGNPQGPPPILLRALDLYRGLGNRRGQLWCLAQMGHDYVAHGQMPEAVGAYEEGLRLGRELRYPLGEAWMLDALAETSIVAGNAVEANARFAEAEAIQRRIRDHVNRGWSLGGLTETHRLQGDLPAAVSGLQEFVDYLAHAGDLAPAHYPRSLLHEAGEVARLAADWKAVGWVIGALAGGADTDDGAHRSMEDQARAAIGDAAIEEARRWGAATPPRAVAERAVRGLAARVGNAP